jgi:hypothetical protein
MLKFADGCQSCAPRSSLEEKRPRSMSTQPLGFLVQHRDPAERTLVSSAISLKHSLILIKCKK